MQRTVLGFLGIAWGSVIIWNSADKLLRGSMGAEGYVLHALSILTGGAILFFAVNYLRRSRGGT